MEMQLDACFYDDFEREILEYRHFICKELLNLRAEKGLSIEEVAFSLSMEIDTLSELENGTFSDYRSLGYILCIFADYFMPDFNFYLSNYRSS